MCQVVAVYLDINMGIRSWDMSLSVFSFLILSPPFLTCAKWVETQSFSVEPVFYCLFLMLYF